MSLLDRYVFVEWLKIFVIAITVTLGILVLHDMYSSLGDLINWGADAGEIVKYYSLFLPTLVPVVLPISLLMSVIFVLGSFHKNNEITAMKAAGLNVFRITRALWLAGAVLAVVLLVLNAYVVPDSTVKSRELKNNIKFRQELKVVEDASKVGAIPQLCFNNRKDGRLWFMNSYSLASGIGRGVRVSSNDSRGGETMRITARECRIKGGVWVFFDGRITEFDSDGQRAKKSTVFDERAFPSFSEDPDIMALSMSRPKDLSLGEARKLVSAMGEEEAEEALPYLVRIYSILGSSFACVIVVAIAIPFSVAGVRTNPMVGVSKTVGLFFAYYILDNIMTALGGRGYLSPGLAMAIPNIAMFLFAISLFRKAQ